MDAVGFAIPLSLSRITRTENCIFNSVWSTFGIDIEENVHFLVTFCDGRCPHVLDAIKEAEIPCRMDSKGLPCHHIFPNGAIYENNKDEDDHLTPIRRKIAIMNFKSFFIELSDMPTKSLQRNLNQIQMEELRKAEESITVIGDKVEVCSGYFGPVFHGSLNGRKVTIKQIPIKEIESHEKREKILRQFDHPNVIKLLQVTQDADFRSVAFIY